MEAALIEELALKVKSYVTDNLALSDLSDEELEEKIEELTSRTIGNSYVSIEDRVAIVKKVYSSIRGLGLLDEIMNDDSITEVMINGHQNVFIEKSGKVQRMDKEFESQRRLEDIIQRIVGMAGREVNQANPIVDTRLADGSRVNVDRKSVV